ncbi:hypothetical protein ALC62_00623 [Cyphomyrmex costatus]|uniref:Uncharacterized protein n=1 Tax=Cyphomyrmex costatus TaxID=456900 RepID=A0A151IQ93_9HYME|nr:hypothetical protein ALC62_00623 [Cyphomyrmex costatus]
MTPFVMQNDIYGINTNNPCKKFTETIYKCKSFLKELQRNNKYLRSMNRPSKMSKISSLKSTHTTGQTALSTRKERETFCDASIIVKKEEINEIKCVERTQGNMVKDTEETYPQNKVNISKDVVALKTNNCAPSRELVPVIPIMQPTHNIQPSQETLIEVRKRLQNLHNVLQTYQDTSKSTKRQESTNQIDEIDSFITYPVMDISSEYFELNRSEDSLSSLAEYSSRTSKTYQRSSENLTLRNTYSKGFSQHDIRSNLSAFVPAELHLRSSNAILQTLESYENEYKECLCENILDCSRNHETELNTEVNKDAIKANTFFDTRDNISEAISERIFYTLSPENKDIQIQNEALLEERFATKKFSDSFDKKQYRENVTISQNSSQSKISNNSNNRGTKSTVLLLQEALHFKNTLLTHLKKKCPISNVKQGDIAGESSLISNNNFPSMIVDIKEKEPVVSNSHDKINQRYICLEMKQRRDLFPQYLKKINTLEHYEDEQDIKNQDCISETSSQYFSITDLTSHNNSVEIKNNVSLKPPIYEKVISITIPVDMDERSMQTKTDLSNIRTCIQENLRENTVSDIDNNIADKRSPTMLKFEDLILERVKDIRDYIDTFLQNQNIAIFKARRALQCQGKNNVFRCSNEASHVIVYNRSIAPSSSNSADQIFSSSKKSSDILTNAWPNYIKEYKQETENDLKCSSDLYLKRNPGMFALITPINNKFSIKNDTQQSEIPTELEKEDVDLFLPKILTHKTDSKSTYKIPNSITPCCEEHIVSNTENDKIDKSTIVDVNADFNKRKMQTQITESKPSIISYFSLDVANGDAKVIHTAREDCLTKSNYNSISHSNSYFTDEEIISDVKMDNVSSKSTLDMKHSYLKLNVQKEMKQNVIKQQISVDKCPDINIVTPNKLSSEYSNLTILINSNLILDNSKRDYPTNPKTSPLTTLKENNFIFDPAASLLSLSLNKENKTLNTDSILNDLKQNDEISIYTANLSPRIKHCIIKPFQTYSQVKAKSDMSLITNRRKDLKVKIYPKKSHSLLIRHNMKYISGTLHQPYPKLHNDKNKCVKNKLRLITQSKSIILPQKISTKSSIPILKNRLESSHRMKHQGHARSPPLTMLRKKTCTKIHATDEEVVQNDNVSINRHLHVEKTHTVSNLTKLNLEKNIFNEESEKRNMTCRENTSKKYSEIVSSDQNVKSLAIDKKQNSDKNSDKSDIYGSKSDTSIMQHIKKIASKEMIVISIMANDDLRKKYPADLFILNTKNISPTTDLLIHKNKLWTITVEKKEKEITAKPSITDTCTSMSNLQYNE